MNLKQRIALFATAAILVVMLLFPPFRAKASGVTVSAGYKFILLQKDLNYFEVETSLLFLQFIIITAVGVLLFFAFKTNLGLQLDQEVFRRITAEANRAEDEAEIAKLKKVILMFENGVDPEITRADISADSEKMNQ